MSLTYINIEDVTLSFNVIKQARELMKQTF